MTQSINAVNISATMAAAACQTDRSSHMSRTNKQTILDRLEDCFDLRSDVSTNGLVYGSAWEDQDILTALQAKNGKVDDEFVGYFFDSLANFTPKGFATILPFYLRFALIHPTSDVAERVIFRCANLKPASKYLGAFTQDQLEVLRIAFIELEHGLALAGESSRFMAEKFEKVRQNLNSSSS
ncbi:MAG: hypothetical protein R3D51_17055 [Hyphomicrobiaceae bacterium]